MLRNHSEITSVFLDFHRACPGWDHNCPATGEREYFILTFLPTRSASRKESQEAQAMRSLGSRSVVAPLGQAQRKRTTSGLRPMHAGKDNLRSIVPGQSLRQIGLMKITDDTARGQFATRCAVACDVLVHRTCPHSRHPQAVRGAASTATSATYSPIRGVSLDLSLCLRSL